MILFQGMLVMVANTMTFWSSRISHLNKILLVGGCKAPYHRLEPIEPVLRELLASVGVQMVATGIYHPDSGEVWSGDYSAINDTELAKYDGLVLYTTGKDPMGADVSAIRRFVETGGALIGIHNATDSFMEDAEYIALIGGRFRTHPAQLDIALEVVNSAHPVMQGVEAFTVHDELYLFSDYDASRIELLAQTHSYPEEGAVPLAWTRTEGEGRVFYVSLGHNPSTMLNPHWQRLFLNGVLWAIGR